MEGLPELELFQNEAQAAKDRLTGVAERIFTFRNEIRPELEQAINDYLRTQIPQTSVEKKRIVEQIQGLLVLLR